MNLCAYIYISYTYIHGARVQMDARAHLLLCAAVTICLQMIRLSTRIRGPRRRSGELRRDAIFGLMYFRAFPTTPS